MSSLRKLSSLNKETSNNFNTQLQVNNKLTVLSDLNKIFLSANYQIMQPFIQVFEEGYSIASSDQSEIYSASRPRSWFKRFLSRMASYGTALLVFILSVVAFSGLVSKDDTTILLVAAIFSLAVAIGAAILMVKLTSPKRKAILSDRDSREILSIKPSSGIFFFNYEYNIESKNGQILATFKKRFLDNIFRIHWHCYNPQGQYLFSASEDSIFMSLIRRFFIFGKYLPVHFVFHKQGGKKFGSFTRRYSLRDKYKLDYKTDAIDGWLVVATAILLDTGESR
jgi:hypothetical protein